MRILVIVLNACVSTGFVLAQNPIIAFAVLSLDKASGDTQKSRQIMRLLKGE